MRVAWWTQVVVGLMFVFASVADDNLTVMVVAWLGILYCFGRLWR